MGTRYEMFDASRTAVELWSAALAEEQTGEQLDPGDVALSLADDEAAVLVGTPEALRAVAEKITRAVAEPPGELRTLTPGEVDELLTCPDCGNELQVTVQEVDYRRGARWNAEGSVNVRKSNEVEVLDVDLFCPEGHGSFELPDVDDYD
jgi:hypothetical protein